MSRVKRAAELAPSASEGSKAARPSHPSLEFRASEATRNSVRDEALVVESDLTVVGAGLAGVAAALSAARLGLRVALVTDRSVLGGNAGKEVRLDANGAEWFGLYRRESGIIEEIKLENLYRNPQANIHIWDLVLLETVRREKNIRMFFDAPVFDVRQRGKNISEVVGFQTTTGRRLVFRSPLFVDATGDGTVAFFAGAAFLQGHDARARFHEPSSPARSNANTMGNSLLMSFTRADRPVPFQPPDFAYSLPVIRRMVRQSRLRLRDVQRYGRWGVAFWWIEYGGIKDTIADAEDIRVELERIIWGVYNYMKNGGVIDDAEHLDLAWMQSGPGKRESRRILGDHVLTERDVLEGVRFPDAVAYGGWPMDDHPAAGFWGKQSAVSRLVDPYDIPLRSLYARDVNNLFLAGRDISVSHFAFSSTRVMATCAQIGQAVGAAAAACARHGVAPRALAADSGHVSELQDLLVRNDATILNRPYDLRHNKARTAVITASSTFDLRNTRTTLRRPLTEDAWFLCHVAEGMRQVAFKADIAKDARVQFEVHRSKAPLGYAPVELLDRQVLKAAPGSAAWLPVSLDKAPTGEPVFIRILRNRAVTLHGNTNHFTLFTAAEREEAAFDRVRHTKFTQAEHNLCFKVTPAAPVHRPECVVDGYTRPFARPHGWISRPGESPAWLAFEWGRPIRVRRIDLFLNPDFNGRINTSSRNPSPERPTMVRNYTVSARQGSRWKMIRRVRDNHQRWNRHLIEKPLQVDALRIDFEATWGAPYFEVFEVIVYNNPAVCSSVFHGD